MLFAMSVFGVELMTVSMFFVSLRFTPSKAQQPLRHEVARKRSTKRSLKHTENLFKNNIRLKDVC